MIAVFWFCCVVSQIMGAAWYLLAIERIDTCWQQACDRSANEGCSHHFLYCEDSNTQIPGYDAWSKVNNEILNKNCGIDKENEEDPPFDYGIYTRAIKTAITASRDMWTKFCLCFWWGLQNVRCVSYLILCLVMFLISTFLIFLFPFILFKISWENMQGFMLLT